MTDIEVYTIDSNTPLPDGKQKVPLNQLEIGESFIFAIDRRNVVASMASVLSKKTGKKFTIRKESDNVARVWRKA